MHRPYPHRRATLRRRDRRRRYRQLRQPRICPVRGVLEAFATGQAWRRRRNRNGSLSRWLGGRGP